MIKRSGFETMKLHVATERIEKRILLVRGHKVMLDADIARLYGVTVIRPTSCSS